MLNCSLYYYIPCESPCGSHRSKLLKKKKKKNASYEACVAIFLLWKPIPLPLVGLWVISSWMFSSEMFFLSRIQRCQTELARCSSDAFSDCTETWFSSWVLSPLNPSLAAHLWTESVKQSDLSPIWTGSGYLLNSAAVPRLSCTRLWHQLRSSADTIIRVITSIMGVGVRSSVLTSQCLTYFFFILTDAGFFYVVHLHRLSSKNAALLIENCYQDFSIMIF